MKSMTRLFHKEKYVYVMAVGLSLLLSWWFCYRETVINPDAICYLLSAKAIGTSGLQQAMQLCGQARWPFYSLVIYSIAAWSHLSYLQVAYLIDGLFTAITVLMFILAVKELAISSAKVRQTTRLLWLAAFVILLAHTFNSVRVYIIRDHGFWAFYLGSLFFLLRFLRMPAWKNALAWDLCMLAAALFRIEGVVFLLAIPFCVWFMPLKHRTKNFMMLNSFTLLALVVLGIWLSMHPHAVGQLGRLPELLQQLQHGVATLDERYETNKLALVQHVLTPAAAREAGLILVLTMILAYVVNVINNLSVLYLLLVFYAWWQRAAAFNKSILWALSSYLIVNVAITLMFYLEHTFLSKRYLIALSLVLMLWVPFALSALIQKRHRMLVAIAALWMAVTGIGGMVNFGYSKAYMREAGYWLSTHVPATAALYANDGVVMYYSGHFGNSIFVKMPEYAKLEKIAQGEWKRYDYLALRLNKHDNVAEKVVREINRQPIQVFSNTRGDKVVIYQVTGESP